MLLPKEKSEELINKYLNIVGRHHHDCLSYAEKCTLLLIKELLIVAPSNEYWKEVEVETKSLFKIYNEIRVGEEEIKNGNILTIEDAFNTNIDIDDVEIDDAHIPLIGKEIKAKIIFEDKSHQLPVWCKQPDVCGKSLTGKCVCPIGQGELEVNKANAKLIASAPKLLAALIEISEGKGRYNEDKLIHASNTIEDMIQLAKNAINEAVS